jgi:DNA-binding LacI/PurR family transcriptional regulator
LSIRELARHLNISIGTVSRALNGRADVNADTRRRVLDAAARLGYSPNQSGRSLRKGLTGMVAALIPTSWEMPLADPFFSTVLDGFRLFLDERGLDLVIMPCGEKQDAFAFFQRAVARRLADGFLISETEHDDPRIAYMLEREIAFVAFGRNRSPDSYPWVDLDFEGVAERSVDRLVRRGHRRIALAIKDTEINYGYVFATAYRAALQRRGLPVDEGMVFRGPGNAEGGYRVGAGVLAAVDRPTALIMVDEKMAVGLYRKLGEADLIPGRDLAIIAFQEGPNTKFLSPKLTCFRANLHGLGVRLGEALFATMPGYAPPGSRPMQALWPMELIVGESDGAPPLMARS